MSIAGLVISIGTWVGVVIFAYCSGYAACRKDMTQ